MKILDEKFTLKTKIKTETDVNEEDMASIIAYNIPCWALKYYLVYTTLRSNPVPFGKHRYEPFDGWSGLPPLGNDDPLQTVL